MATLDKLTTILEFKTDLSSLRRAEAAVAGLNSTVGQVASVSQSAAPALGSLGGSAAVASTKFGSFKQSSSGLLLPLSHVGDAAQETAQKTETLGKRVGGVTGKLSSASTILGAVAASLVAAKLVEYADTWTLVGNRVALYTENAAETERVQRRLFEISQGTRSSLEATATLYQRVAMANDSLNVSQDRLLGFTQTLNQAFVVSGASAQEARNAVIQFSQGLASGELRGEEFRSVTEQGTRVIQALAQSLGVTRGELREMAHTGQLTSDVVFKAIEQDAANIRQEFEKLTPTIGQSFTVLGNSLTAAVGQFSEATGAANFFAQAITGIAGAIDAVTTSGRRQDQQLTAAQRRRQNRARQIPAAAPAAPGTANRPPPGLTPLQRRQWLRGRGRDLGIEGGFADAGETRSPREFREFTTTGGLALEGFGGAGFGGRQNLLGLDMTPNQTAEGIAAGRAYLQKVLEASATGPGLDSGGFTGMQQSLFGLGEAFQGLGNVTDDVGVQLRAEEAAKKDGIKTGREYLEGLVKQAPVLTTVRANILGLNVDADRTGISIGLAGTKSERWSQGLANLGGVLADTVARTNRFAGAALSIVQGAATGGPLGALAAGISSLGGILFGSAKASREAARAERERMAALFASRQDVTASGVAEARRIADPEGLNTAQAAIFGQLSQFLQGIAPSSRAGGDAFFGPGGRVEQFFNTLGSLDLFAAGDIDRAQLGSLGSRLEPLIEGFRRTFGDISFAELGRRFLDSPAFAQIFGGGEGLPDLGAPLQAGPATTPYQQAVAEGRAGEFAGPAPIHVTVEQLTVDIDAAGADPDAIGDMFDRRFRGQLRAVAEAVDTQIKA